MTMPHPNHPDDERLAALADADLEAERDASLVDHVAACGRCASVIRDLRELRGALAALPDIAPPRPLRLLPAVPEAPPARGWLPFLRRLTVPAMALAVGLIVVGAVGTAMPLATGAAGGGQSTSALDGRQVPAAMSSAEGMSAPSADAEKGPSELGPETRDASIPVPQPTLPYTGFLGAGVVLLAGAVLVRAHATRRGSGG